MSTAERWNAIVGSAEDEIDLAEAALLIAADEYRELDIPAYLTRIEEMGAELRRRLRLDISPTETILALNHYLFDELGFAGNADDYYDPRNSFLNDVLDRRVGIPITLAVLYIEIGRRVGLLLHGVSFPGHFLVKCVVRDGAIVLDPYARGASLGLEDLQERLQALHGSELPLQMVRQALTATAKKEILARMLRNLKSIYRKRSESERALSAAHRLVALVPEVADEYWERAAIFLELECFRAAAADLHRYLQLEPGAEDAAQVRRELAEVEKIAARLN
jgi:regulator of sirC expression with transglutaminase-like and TPR domain